MIGKPQSDQKEPIATSNTMPKTFLPNIVNQEDVSIDAIVTHCGTARYTLPG
jgi:hypothetical protein